MKKLSFILVSMVLASLCSFSVSAEEMKDMHQWTMPTMGTDSMMKMPEITDEQKQQMEAQMKSFMTSMEELKKALKGATTQEERDYVQGKIKALLEDNKAKMEAFVPWITEMRQKMEKMMKEKMGNPDMPKPKMGGEKKQMESGTGEMGGKKMKEMMEKMKERMGKDMPKPKMEHGSGSTEDMNSDQPRPEKQKEGGRGKFKEMFAKKLAGKLQDMSLEKLQSVMTKLAAAEEKIRAGSVSENKKATLLAQIWALKELVQEQIDQKQPDAQLNLDEIFQ
jgi:hypothetical protein